MMFPVVTPLATQAPCVTGNVTWCSPTNPRFFQISRELIVRDHDGKYYFEAWTDDGRKILIPILLEVKK